MNIKITPEQYKAVKSYIDYMMNLYRKPQALPPPPGISNATKAAAKSVDSINKGNIIYLPPSLSQAEKMKKAMDYDNYIMNLVRNTPTTKALEKTISQPTAATTAVAQNASKNNPFYKSVSSWVKDNPKTSYSSIASLFAAPILYSMFGGSKDAPSGTVSKGTNTDTNDYKLLANKAKQDINKEYAAAHNSTTGNNTVTNTQSATQNADNDLKQLNELDARIDANMAKLKALETETLRRIQEQQANQKLPQNPQLGTVWDTSSADIGVAINNGTNNPAENVVNTTVKQATTQGATTPEKKEKPVTGTNKGTGNVLGDAVKKKVNQDTKKNANNGNTGKLNNSATGKVATEYAPYTPVEIPGFSAEEYIKNNPEFAMPKQTFSNNTDTANTTNGKTALNEAQSDYYRYLTGYKRMDPNQAISYMGLDPNKYHYIKDPAYYH